MEKFVAMDVEGFSNILREFNIYDEELVKKFENMLNTKDSPSSYFDFIGSGAFKECYRLTEDFIIKFNSSDNPTDQEREILTAAEGAGLSAIFLPTKFHELKSCTLPLYYLDECSSRYLDVTYDSYYHTIKTNPNYTPISFNSFFIQPFAKIGRMNPAKTSDWGPLIDENGDIISNDAVDFIARYWTRSVLSMYGKQFFYKMINFFEEKHIHDLHTGNIGYLDGKPIIIDWMSE